MAPRVIDDHHAFSHHGGALDAARRVFPTAPEPWLDLSTGINPRSYPCRGLTLDDWTRLPSDGSLFRLEQLAARRYQAPPSAVLVAAPGTQAIIQQLPALLGGSDVRILGPTYREFERVFAGIGVRSITVDTLQRLAGADVAIVVNPNNPDGRLVAPPDLLALAPRVGSLVVDEAFVDALPAATSVLPNFPSSRLVVLRSFGKIFGLAGLRLGFAAVPLPLADALRRRLGPWAVSGPAIAIGTRALDDTAWLEEARSRLGADGARLDYLLRRTGAETVGGTPLFRLIAHPAARSLFATLAGHGVLVRPFAEEARWLRFGLPGSEEEWQRLDGALRAFR